MDVANASLLDEATSASEGLAMTYRHNKRNCWFVANNVHQQTLSVVRTRASALGIEVHVADPRQIADFGPYSGILLQYPDTYGYLLDYEEIVHKAHNDGVRILYNILHHRQSYTDKNLMFYSNNITLLYYTCYSH